MFLVVKFIATDEVEVIHENWLESNSKCFWPPFKKPGKIKKMILDGKTPQNDWYKCDIQVMGHYDFYHQAKEKVVVAQFNSSENEEETDEHSGKFNSSENEEETDEHSEKFNSSENEEETDEQSENEQSLLGSPKLPDSSSLFNSDLCLNKSASNSESQSATKKQKLTESCDNGMCTKCSSSSSSTSRDTSKPSISCSSQTLVSSALVELASFQRTVLGELEKIRKDIEVMSIKLNSLLDKPVKDYELLFSFPFDQDDDFKKFEIYLENPANFSKSVKYFSTTGGRDVPRTTRRILSSIMTNNLANNYNWAGRPPKRAFFYFGLPLMNLTTPSKHCIV